MATIAEQLANLNHALLLAEGRLDPAVVQSGRAVAETVRERGGLGSSTTVAALLGATGSGKSSLLNALTKTNYARVAHTRPTTLTPLAVAGNLDPQAIALLDWLGVEERASSDTLSDDLVLLDLPDVDSVERTHRELSTRMTKVVDVLIWVLDPQKYADAVVHTEFLAPLARHAEVTIVVLNQIDRIRSEDVAAVLADVTRLLAADGLNGVTVVATSVLTGQGIGELQRRLTDIGQRREAIRAKSRMELEFAAIELLRGVNTGEVTLADATPVVAAAVGAAGTEALATAVARSHRRRSALRVGWPFLRWVHRFRRDPLARLQLASGRSGRISRRELVPVASLPETGPVQAAQLEATAAEFVLGSTVGLPQRWRSEIGQDNPARLARVSDALDRELAGLKLPVVAPKWWRFGAVVQYLAGTAAICGLGWLVASMVGGLFQVNLTIGGWYPVPLAAVVSVLAVAVGISLALVGRLAAAIGSRRAAARTRKLIQAVSARVVQRELVSPVAGQLEEYRQFVTAAVGAQTRTSRRYR